MSGLESDGLVSRPGGAWNIPAPREIPELITPAFYSTMSRREIQRALRETDWADQIFAIENGTWQATYGEASSEAPVEENAEPIVAEEPVETVPEGVVEPQPEPVAALEVAPEPVQAAPIEPVAPPILEEKEYISDFQVTDEDGNPVARRVNIRSKSAQEHIQKLEKSYSEVSKYAARLKKQITPEKRIDLPVITDEQVAEAQKALDSSDDHKAVAKAIRTLTEASNIRAEQARREAVEAQQAYMFMQKHMHDYNQCQANGILMKGWLDKYGYAYTVENLELAFDALAGQLAPVAETTSRPIVPSVSAVPVANPPVAAPAQPVVSVATPVASVPQIAAVVPAQPPVNPAKVTPRPGVNLGVAPRSVSGGKPQPQLRSKSGLTLKEFNTWSGTKMRQKMREAASQGIDLEAEINELLQAQAQKAAR